MQKRRGERRIHLGAQPSHSDVDDVRAVVKVDVPHLFGDFGARQNFAGAPHLPAWLIYPLFWAAYGVVSPFIRASN